VKVETDLDDILFERSKKPKPKESLTSMLGGLLKRTYKVKNWYDEQN